MGTLSLKRYLRAYYDVQKRMVVEYEATPYWICGSCRPRFGYNRFWGIYPVCPNCGGRGEPAYHDSKTKNVVPASQCDVMFHIEDAVE